MSLNYDHPYTLECSWEGRRSYFLLLRNLIARQSTCQEAVFFRGNVYASLILKDYIRGIAFFILSLGTPPQSGRYPIQGGMREVISGRGGHWGPRKLGIDSPRHQQPVRPNPRDELPARTSVPSHKHKHGMQGCACPASRWYCNSCLPPNTYVHNSLDSNWE